MRRVPRRRRRTIKSLFTAALCAGLALLSPGGKCYAAAAVVIGAPAAQAGVSAAGLAARAAAAPIGPALSAISPVPSAFAPSLAFAPAPSAAPSAAAPVVPAAASALVPAAAAAPIPAVIPAPAASAHAADASRAISAAAPAARVALESGARRLAEAAPSDRASAIAAFFSGSRRTDESAPLDKVRVFINRSDLAPGETPASASLSELPALLAADPALMTAVNRSGRIRVVLSKSAPEGSLTRADAAAVQASLRAAGVTAKLEIENISIDWKAGASLEVPAAPSPASAAAGPARANPAGGLWQRALHFAAAPFREAAYLGRTFRASFTAPTWGAVVAGVVMKLVIPLVVLRQAGWISQYAGHPIAMALALGFSVSINLFHGVWVGTWANFQNSLGKQRGLRYQAVFNFVYGQFLGVVSRIIAWSAIAGTVPPWSYRFWKDVGIMAVAGTFFGTLGYQGINTLYNNGRFSQRQRDGIFLFRDLVMNLAGYFFGSGSMAIFWTVFLAQQATDFAIYAVSRKLKPRTIVYVADEAVSASPEFQAMYPVGPRPAAQESPLKQAWQSVIGSPFVKPIVWALKKLRDIFRKS